MGRREAERCLELPEFDIPWRYADALNSFALSLALGAFASPYGWQVLGWLCVYLVTILLVDRLLLLRHSSFTVYTTCTLSIAFGLLWCVPVGICAGLTVRCISFDLSGGSGGGVFMQ